MISAKVITDSLSPQGKRLTTLEVVMPRYILAEFNTHRVLSKNSASSRAIPFNKMIKNVQDTTFIPYAWQKDHKGMQGNEYITNPEVINFRNHLWLEARDYVVQQACALNSDIKISKSEQEIENGIFERPNDFEGVTKQLANRLLEPFMYHKVLVSGTEFSNFFELRCPVYTIDLDNLESLKK